MKIKHQGGCESCEYIYFKAVKKKLFHPITVNHFLAPFENFVYLVYW